MNRRFLRYLHAKRRKSVDDIKVLKAAAAPILKSACVYSTLNMETAIISETSLPNSYKAPHIKRHISSLKKEVESASETLVSI